jgi:hypothetical protein
MFNVGDYVYWKAYAGAVPVERAGKVVAVVPANTPLSLAIPSGISCRHDDISRPDVSYIIKVDGIQYAFWPNAAHLSALTPEKVYVLDNQPKSSAHFVLKTVDRTDRKKLKELATMMRDKFRENQDMLEVYAWHTRFWFETVKGVESIASIDRW